MFEHVAREPLEGSKLKGDVKKSEVIEVTAFLGHENEVIEKAHDIANKPISDRKYLARDDRVFQVTPEESGQLKKFADSNNLEIGDIVGRTVKLSGKASDIGKAFNVDLLEYNHPDGNYRTYKGTVKGPDFIQSVHGLDTRQIFRHHLSKRGRPRKEEDSSDPSSSANPSSYISPSLAKAYNFPTNKGTGQTVGIIELGGGYRDSDLTAYWSRIAGVSNPPTVVSVGVDGASNRPGSSADIEVDLDVMVPGAIANGAKYIVYFAPNTDQGFIDAITTASHDSNKCNIISISWGGTESEWSANAIKGMEAAFQACASLGITVFAASGDAGNKDDGRNISVDYPSSSVWVTGCGGTNIVLNNDSSIQSETGWRYAGGGSSSLFATPPWQSGIKPPTAGKRGVPDVSALAGSPGFTIISDGQTGPVQGTSCVAPLWAGLTACINSSLGKSVGFLNPSLYTAPSKTFNDITQGSNGFSCTPGWDPVTGLGSPNGQALLTALGGTGTGTIKVSDMSITVDKVSQDITLMATGATVQQFTVNSPSHGNISVPASQPSNNSITVTYTPNTGYTGPDSFTYTATDTAGNVSNTGTVSITVNPVIVPGKITVPASLAYQVLQNQNVAVTLAATDTFSGISSITYGIVAQPVDGVILPMSGTTALQQVYSYHPNPNFAGEDTFTYQARDNLGNFSNIGTISLAVVTSIVPANRYMLRTTQQKGDTVPDSSWSVVYDSGPI